MVSGSEYPRLMLVLVPKSSRLEIHDVFIHKVGSNTKSKKLLAITNQYCIHINSISKP